MTYPEFIKELIARFGEDKGVVMALRAEVGFLRRFLDKNNPEVFVAQESEMIQDFLERHPKE